MSNFTIKESARKIHHPTDDPIYEKKKKIAERNIKQGKMKFATEAEERDYRKRVNANPNNVYGLPALYPAQTLTFGRAKYDKRDCPTCNRVIYDELECMYCGTDLKLINPY